MTKTLIKTLLSIGIGAVFVWLAIRDVHLDQVASALTQVKVGPVVLFAFIFFIVHLSRILRWGLLLRPLGNIPFGRVFSVGSVGFMALVVLPLRLGEFARPMLITEKGKIRMSAALATIVVERIVDSVVMAGLLVSILLMLEGSIQVPGDLRFWAWIVFVFFVCLFFFLMLAYWKQDTTIRLISSLFGRLSEKLSTRLTSIVASFIDGLKVLPDAKLLVSFLLLTGVYWFANGLGLLVLFGGFSDLSQLGMLEAFAVLSVLCVGLMIPAGPGMIGNFHYFIKVGLSLFVAESVLGTSGVAYSILVHAIQIGLQVVLGIVCLFSGHITFRSIWYSQSAMDLK